MSQLDGLLGTGPVTEREGHASTQPAGPDAHVDVDAAPADAELPEPVIPEAPATGDAQVDEAVARLEGVVRLPAAEQVGVFEAVHAALTDRLADVEG